MNSAVRFSRGHARMHALKASLWGPADRALLVQSGIDPQGRPLSGAFADVFPPLVRWYVTLMASYPSARRLFLALIRLHEIENLKLLWRAAVSRRAAVPESWRPLDPLATLTFAASSVSPQELVHQMASTPYAEVAPVLLRDRAGNAAAAEIGLERWAWATLLDEAKRLDAGEAAARALVASLVRERDVDLLRRGVSFGLDADLVAKSTLVLSDACSVPSLIAAALWQRSHGPLWRVLPPALLRLAGEARDWDAVATALRRVRLRACRRTFVGWPFQLAPAIAALLLREEQARIAISVAASRRTGDSGRAALPRALAATMLEY